MTIARSAGRGAAGQPVPATPARSVSRWPDWMVLAPAAMTLAAALWGISSASLWRDEAATVSATRRGLPALLRLLRHTDAVHGMYYLMMWPLVHLLGTSELVLRLPSAVAMAAAALGTAAIGRRLWSRPAGLLAGAVFATLPVVSRYGQEARPYAVVTALATLASYLLSRAADEPRPRRLAGYGLSLAALSLGNVFGLLLVPAHAVTVARRKPALLGQWAAAVAAAFAVTAPVTALTWRQRGQLGWLRKPHWSELYGLATFLAGGGWPLAIIAAAASAAAAHAAFRGHGGRGRDGDRAAAGRSLIWLSVPWAVLPPAILFGVSAVTPMYLFRYLLFCLPALALLAGAGLDAVARLCPVPPVPPAAALAAVVALTIPVQHSVREPAGHSDNIRAVARLLRAHEHAGDAVVYDDPGTRVDSFAYPYGFSGLRDISLRQSPAASATLGGTQAPANVVARRLATAVGVWVIQVGPGQHPDVAAVAAPRFELLRTWLISDIKVQFFRRTAWPGDTPGARRPGSASRPG